MSGAAKITVLQLSLFSGPNSFKTLLGKFLLLDVMRSEAVLFWFCVSQMLLLSCLFLSYVMAGEEPNSPLLKQSNESTRFGRTARFFLYGNGGSSSGFLEFMV